MSSIAGCCREMEVCDKSKTGDRNGCRSDDHNIPDPDIDSFIILATRRDDVLFNRMILR